MATSHSRCGSQPDSPNDRHGASRGNSALILGLALPGLVIFPLAVAAVVLGARYRKNVERGALPDSKVARLGFVLGGAGVLTGSLQLLSVLYLLPVLVSPGIEENKSAAMAALRDIHRAQVSHMRLTDEYAASLELLRERGFLDSNFKELQAYRLELTVSENLDNYQARAIPRKPRLQYFFIDQTGVLRDSDSADIGPHSPAVDVFLKSTHSESP